MKDKKIKVKSLKSSKKERFMRFLEEIFRTLFFFAIGAAGYYGVETVARGMSHWTMAIAGGGCFVIIMRLSLSKRRFLPSSVKALIIALVITGVELLLGIYTRKVLGIFVWNYSDQPFNYDGYICLLFSLIWFAISFPIMWFAKVLSLGLDCVMKRSEKVVEKKNVEV